MISPAKYEAALCQIEQDPPDIRKHNDNIREERWTHFYVEGVKFPTATVDVMQRGEALAIFERDLILHFQQITKAVAWYVRHRRGDDATNSYPWSLPTTEETWRPHAEGVLMVALTNLNLPPEAWRSARLLRAVPNCRLVFMLAYHMLSPALSIEEAGLMTYLQTPPDAGPSVTQATAGLQNWNRGGRRLVQIGRLPTATPLRQSLVKILSKHLADNKKVSAAYQQKSSTMPMMNPSSTEIVELFTFVEVTLVEYATVAGRFPGVAAAVAKAKPKKVNKRLKSSPRKRRKPVLSQKQNAQNFPPESHKNMENATKIHTRKILPHI